MRQVAVRRRAGRAGGGRADETKVRAYLDHAPKMIRYLEDKSRVRYAVAEKYPDYYQHLPGALPGGRSLDPELFDTSTLGEELANSEAFAMCQAQKTFRAVCLRGPTSPADVSQLEAMSSNFRSDGYQLKSLFADAAVYCMGE